MAEHQIDDPLFDYKVYRYGRSRQLFRGPQPNVRGKYVSFVGSSHTFGRYVDQPYPTVLEDELDVPILNLGADGAGPGFFLADPEVLRAASQAEVCVVQAMCARALSNRMFSVRPRRNLRLHAISDLLRGIYPEVDFSRFSFVKGMLNHLETVDAVRYKLVVNEMRNAWIGRMQSLLAALETKTVLFWFSQRAPEETSLIPDDSLDMHYPQYVDRAMIDAVKDSADAYVECTSTAGMPQDLTVDGRTVLYRPSGEPIDKNREYPSPEMHYEAADALAPEIDRLFKLP